ncbi:MAG: PfkB family carbohydrate kinase, partial [Chthoniobacterales bacterium]
AASDADAESDPDSLIPAASGAADFRDARCRGVLCVGEVLFDGWPDGRVFPGGAPANVAFHVAAVGEAGSLVSRMGSDERGARLRAWLTDAGVGHETCQMDPVEATGWVEVLTGGTEGPSYRIANPSAWDFIEMNSTVIDALGQARVLVIGTLAQRHPRSRETIRQSVQEARAQGVTVLADLNLRAPFFDEEIVLWTLRHIDVLKLNLAELQTVCGLLGARGSVEELFAGLLHEFGLARGVLTCGADGALFREAGESWHQPAGAAEVADTTGCGDAFGAVLAVALARGRSLREAAPAAAQVAAFVATRTEATPRWPDDLRARVREVMGLG